MIKYICKYCGEHLGAIDDTAITREQLGLDSLTLDERQSIITYESNGDIVAKIICEYCQEAIEKTPELSLISNPLQ